MADDQIIGNLVYTITGDTSPLSKAFSVLDNQDMALRRKVEKPYRIDADVSFATRAMDSIAARFREIRAQIERPLRITADTSSVERSMARLGGTSYGAPLGGTGGVVGGSSTFSVPPSNISSVGSSRATGYGLAAAAIGTAFGSPQSLGALGHAAVAFAPSVASGIASAASGAFGAAKSAISLGAGIVSPQGALAAALGGGAAVAMRSGRQARMENNVRNFYNQPAIDPSQDLMGAVKQHNDNSIGTTYTLEGERCPNCGATNPSGASNCRVCGTSLRGSMVSRAFQAVKSGFGMGYKSQRGGPTGGGFLMNSGYRAGSAVGSGVNAAIQLPGALLGGIASEAWSSTKSAAGWAAGIGSKSQTSAIPAMTGGAGGGAGFTAPDFNPAISGLQSAARDLSAAAARFGSGGSGGGGSGGSSPSSPSPFSGPGNVSAAMGTAIPQSSAPVVGRASAIAQTMDISRPSQTIGQYQNLSNSTVYHSKQRSYNVLNRANKVTNPLGGRPEDWFPINETGEEQLETVHNTLGGGTGAPLASGLGDRLLEIGDAPSSPTSRRGLRPRNGGYVRLPDPTAMFQKMGGWGKSIGQSISSNASWLGRNAAWAGSSAMDMAGQIPGILGSAASSMGGMLSNAGSGIGNILGSNVFGGNATSGLNGMIGSKISSLAKMRVLPRYLPRVYNAAGGLGGLARLGAGAYVAHAVMNAVNGENAYADAEAVNTDGNRHTLMENQLALANATPGSSIINFGANLIGKGPRQARETMAQANTQENWNSYQRASMLHTQGLRASALSISTDPSAQLAGIDLDHLNAQVGRRTESNKERLIRSNAAQHVDDQADALDHWYKPWNSRKTIDGMHASAKAMRDQDNAFFNNQDAAQETAQTTYDTERKKQIARSNSASIYGIRSGAQNNAMSLNDEFGSQQAGIASGYNTQIINAGDNAGMVSALNEARGKDLATNRSKYIRDTGNIAGDGRVARMFGAAHEMENNNRKYGAAQANAKAQIAQTQQAFEVATQGMNLDDPIQAARYKEMAGNRDTTVAGFNSDIGKTGRDFTFARKQMGASDAVSRQGMAGNSLTAALANNKISFDQQRYDTGGEMDDVLNDQERTAGQGIRLGNSQSRFGYSMGTRRINQGAARQKLRNNFKFITADVQDQVDDARNQIREANVTMAGDDNKADREARIKAIKGASAENITGITNPLKRGNRLEEISGYVSGGDMGNTNYSDLADARNKAKTAASDEDKEDNDSQMGGSGSGVTSDQVDKIITLLNQMVTSNNQGI